MNTHVHVLQSPEWASFRKKTGVRVEHISDGFYITVHPIPFVPYTIGYLPKSAVPSQDILRKLQRAGKKHACIFIKLEPDVLKSSVKPGWQHHVDIRVSPHPLFTRHTFHIDLTKSAEELYKQFKPKTRYNIKIAEKHGVIVKDETDNPQAFEHYIELSKKTWRRQHFRGHTEHYHRLMWQTLQPTGIAHLLVAYYDNIPLTAWVLFLYNDTLYYPYGASSDEYKHVMASNLMMAQAIDWGKKNGAKTFDLWGSLGPNPDPAHEWYGFHRFKEGYGGTLVEYMGSFDLVMQPFLYTLYSMAHNIRQRFLQAGISI